MGRPAASVEQGNGVSIVGPELAEPFGQRVLLVDRKIKEPGFFAQTIDLLVAEPFQKHFQSPDCYSRLDIIGPIQTVQAVGSKYAILLANQFATFYLIYIETHWVDNFAQRLDECLAILEFIVFAFLVEIVVLIF